MKANTPRGAPGNPLAAIKRGQAARPAAQAFAAHAAGIIAADVVETMSSIEAQESILAAATRAARRLCALPQNTRADGVSVDATIAGRSISVELCPKQSVLKVDLLPLIDLGEARRLKRTIALGGTAALNALRAAVAERSGIDAIARLTPAFAFLTLQSTPYAYTAAVRDAVEASSLKELFGAQVLFAAHDHGESWLGCSVSFGIARLRGELFARHSSAFGRGVS